MESIINIIQSTYLIERVTSLMIYVIVLYFEYAYICRATTYTQIKRYLNIYLIILVLMAFFFVPDASKDLTRILRNTDYWKNLSLSDVYRYEIAKSTTPIGQFYIYFCRKTQIDGFLPAITAFLFFNNVFYILKKCYKDLNCTSKSIAISLLVFMSSGCFLEVISDIKCFLGFSIVCRCVFEDLCLKKNIVKNVPFYVVASLIHLSVVPIVVLRLLFYIIFESGIKPIEKVFSTMILLIVSGGTVLYFDDLIDAVLNKANSYLSGGHYSYLWEYIIGSVFWLLLVYTLKIYKENKEKHDNDLIMESLNKFSLLFIAVEAIFCFEYNIFHRYLLISLFMSIPFISILISKYDIPKKSQSNIIIISVLVLLLVCMRGNLCGYKFFVLN